MTQEKSTKKILVKPINTAAAAIGIIQGLIWFVLSLFSILIYENVVLVDNDSAGLEIWTTIYNRYLNKDVVFQLDIILEPFGFNIAMYFYLVLNFVWVLLSSTLLWAMIRDKWIYWQYICIGWSFVCVLISILDVTLMGLIAYDYHSLVVYLQSHQDVVLTAVGIVMTLAAKGYILWIVNVVFAFALGKFAYNHGNEFMGSDRSVIDAYSSRPQPPWEITDNSLYDEANAANFEFTNKTYTDDDGLPMFYSSNSFTRLDINNQNKNQLNNSPIIQQVQRNGQNILDPSEFFINPQNRFIRDAANSRTAKIGRERNSSPSRSPPLNVPPPFVPENGNAPYIPPPDYTPPGSPKIKSVLRPKSNYVL